MLVEMFRLVLVNEKNRKLLFLEVYINGSWSCLPIKVILKNFKTDYHT